MVTKKNYKPNPPLPPTTVATINLTHPPIPPPLTVTTTNLNHHCFTQNRSTITTQHSHHQHCRPLTNTAVITNQNNCRHCTYPQPSSVVGGGVKMDWWFAAMIGGSRPWSVLSSLVASVSLSSSKDRWICDLTEDGEFKVNGFAWRARHDRLPTRLNLSRRGVVLDSILCPLCDADVEDVHHVLHRMESMRSHFFNGAELSSKKSVWVKWKHALDSKDKGGLCVSSLFALNRALMFKWVWRFITQGSSLWARVIKALHGYDGKISQKVKSCYPSLWLDIIHEVEMFKSRGIDLVSLIHSKLGNGANTSFWELAWRGGSLFKSLFPRLYALKTQKEIDVASKLSHSGLDVSFRRPPMGGVEIKQFEHIKEKVEGCILANMMDRWFWALEGSGEFTITSVRKMIDDFMLPEVSSKTRWIKAVHIKWDIDYMEISSYEEQVIGLRTPIFLPSCLLGGQLGYKGQSLTPLREFRLEIQLELSNDMVLEGRQWRFVRYPVPTGISSMVLVWSLTWIFSEGVKCLIGEMFVDYLTFLGHRPFLVD
uniref:RNA-directed DNA polymerase, eukaryota, reverse transcriptase zinc-binding domain protein n=1 Tax=Tanacetum cinerariifolium TaxID=118510 RepID=A0A6L2LHC1_TANCI|nr:RNA-directed DNA polymerase, eukaryota, reverse transcriptase zinc-binding domain protein [Tanacetum cinerariifolium]